jgi:hypothetical protein
MFWICIYLELLYVQITSFHYTFCLFHILKMMVNSMVTLLPTVKCLALQHSLLFSILLLLLFFLNNSTSSSCHHLRSLFCISLSFAIFYKFLITLSTLKFLWTPDLWKHTYFRQQMKTTFDDYSVYFHPWASRPSHSFFGLFTVF